MGLALQPGNPDLAAQLAELPAVAVQAHCDQIRAAGMPDEVLWHLLDDMAFYATKTASWTCQNWWSYHLRCTHHRFAPKGAPHPECEAARRKAA